MSSVILLCLKARKYTKDAEELSEGHRRQPHHTAQIWVNLNTKINNVAA